MNATCDPIFEVLAHLQDEADRLMAADYLDDMGLPRTAELLRDPSLPLLVLGGRRLWRVEGTVRRGCRYGTVHLYLPDTDPGVKNYVALRTPYNPRSGRRWSGWGTPYPTTTIDHEAEQLRQRLQTTDY
jgi:hypothetical protein